MSDTSPYSYFYPDTEVLVYTGQGGSDWQPLPFAMVSRGGEFQFDGYLCGIDQEGRVWVSPNISAAQLLKADRNFDPHNWRWPESEDVVRFVDRDNYHLRHDRMGRFQAGDRFWYQGILWEASADPNSPTGVVYWQTAFVQNENGEAVLVDGYPARGVLNEGAYSQAGYTLPADVDATSANPPSDLPAVDASVLVNYPAAQSPVDASSNVAGPTNLGASVGTGQAAAPLAQSFGGAQLGSGGGMPTDFGFAGQRYDSSTGLIHMGARYYDPKLGRFISPDTLVPNPSNPQSFNRYSYAYNNPLRYVDPSGHIPEVIYDPNTDTYTIKLNIQIYGPGAGETRNWPNSETGTLEQISVAEYYKRAIEEMWNTGNPEYNGAKVVFEVNAFEAEPNRPIWYSIPYIGPFLWDEGLMSPTGGDALNIIYVKSGGLGDESAGVIPHISSRRSFDWGMPWAAQMNKGVVVHESSHLFGIYEDRYDGNRDPLPGYEDYISAHPNANLSQPLQAEIDEIIDLAVDRGQVQTLGGKEQ